MPESPAEGVRLIVGLGNPGAEYEYTPHNLGFLVIDRLAERNGIRVTRNEAQTLAGLGTVGGKPVILAKPQLFMNRSGGPVKQLTAKYELKPQQVLVVYDELDLPWTSVRIRPRGSAGGHHGVESVISSLGSEDFPRMRLGIAPGHPVRDGAAFVLAPMKRPQREELDELLDFASQAAESVIAEGVELSMTKFNRRARG